MDIKNNKNEPKYVKLDGKEISIIATIDGIQWQVPLCETNESYVEIMRQAKEGIITIKAADKNTTITTEDK